MENDKDIDAKIDEKLKAGLDNLEQYINLKTEKAVKGWVDSTMDKIFGEKNDCTSGTHIRN